MEIICSVGGHPPGAAGCRAWTRNLGCGWVAWDHRVSGGCSCCLGAGGLQTHLGNKGILEDSPEEQVVMYLPVRTRQGRVSLRMGAVGQGEKVVSHEAKMIQRSETKILEKTLPKNGNAERAGRCAGGNQPPLPRLPRCQHPAGCSQERKQPRGRQRAQPGATGPWMKLPTEVPRHGPRGSRATPWGGAWPPGKSPIAPEVLHATGELGSAPRCGVSDGS